MLIFVMFPPFICFHSGTDSEVMRLVPLVAARCRRMESSGSAVHALELTFCTKGGSSRGKRSRENIEAVMTRLEPRKLACILVRFLREGNAISVWLGLGIDSKQLICMVSHEGYASKSPYLVL